MSDGRRATSTSEHVLTSSFNRFERPLPLLLPPQQRDEATNKWPFNNKFPAANDERVDNELSRRIKWPTDLNSLGIDSMYAFRPVPRSKIPFHFPVSSESSLLPASQPSTLSTSSSLSASSSSSSSHSDNPSHSDQTITDTTTTTTSTAIGDKNHNPNDTSNEMANIVSNVYDIVTNTTNIVTYITNIAIATAAGVPDAAAGATNAAATANAYTQQAIPDGFVPEIYIDENGIFQIKYVRRRLVGKNNETISIEMYTTNAISPMSANNGSDSQQWHTNNTTTSSFNAGIDEAAINSTYDDQQFELDIRFDGRNESVKDSNRDSTIIASSSSSSSNDSTTIQTDNGPNTNINVNVEKSRVNISTNKTVENEHR